MVICPFCGKDISRRQALGNVWEEHYENKFGTYCPQCRKMIPPDDDIRKRDLQKELELQREIIEKLKNKPIGE